MKFSARLSRTRDAVDYNWRMPRSINRTEIEITGICKPFPGAIVIGQAGVGVTKPRCHVCVTLVTNRDAPKQEARIDVMRGLRARPGAWWWPCYYSGPDIFYMRHYPLMGLLPLCLDTVRARLYLAQEAIMRELCPISINWYQSCILMPRYLSWG